MNTLSGSSPAAMESFLSGAYRRILRTAVGLSIVATIVAAPFLGWRGVLGLAAGALVAYLNFIWLHHGTEVMVKRALAPSETAPSKFLMLLLFGGRYVFVVALACVILESYPGVRVGFIVGLACPILAAMGEGFYEVVMIGNKNQPPD
jgi:hypothetical protein